jgi:predicted Zn finger-like uncharacterized protein
MLIAQCPACHARYKVPDEVAGRRAKCKKCGQPFQVPEPPPDSGRLSLTAITPPGEGSTVRLRVDKPQRTAKAEKGVRLRGEAEEKQEAAPGVWGPFIRDLASCLWAPVRPVNLPPFLIAWFLLTIAKPGLWSFLICAPVGLAIWAIINGWYLSFQFNTAVNATDGKAELPTFTFGSGFVDDVLVPLLKMVLTQLGALLPAIIYVAAVILARGGSLDYAQGVGPGVGPLNIYLAAVGSADGGAAPMVALALLAVGLTVWPILVLATAVGGAPAAFRFGTMARGLVRTVPAYALVLLTVYAAAAVGIVMGMALGRSLPDTSEANVTRIVVYPALIALADVYLTIIATRALGLYYHHFKQKLALV